MGNARVTQAAVLALVTKTPSLTQRCQLWKITRADAFVFAYTTHDENVDFRGVTYKACESLSATATDAGILSAGGIGDTQINGLLVDDAITEHDLVNGLFDGARVEVWEHPWGGDDQDVTRLLTRGVLGKTTHGGVTYSAEMLSPGVKLSQKPLLDTYTPACRYRDLADPRCPVSPELLRITGSVTSVESRDAFNRATYRRFTDTSLVSSSNAQADGFWSLGILTWITGDNAGIESEVKSDAAGVVTLWNSMPEEIAVNDTYSIIPGCDGSVESHTVKYGLTMIDFGGQPDIPGTDNMVRTPNAK